MGETVPRYVTPQQLRIGLHVHVDLPWTDHPFTFSSFKIRSLDQIQTLQSLGLTRIRYSPGKSDCEPLPEAPMDDTPLPVAPRDDPVYDAKRERIERLSAQRRRAAACEREFLSAARAMKSINHNLFAQPGMAREEASKLVQTMTDSLLVEADIAIHLMKDKIGGDDVYFHSLNVALLAMTLAKELKAPAELIHALGMGAVFHDVGKLNLPDRITRKMDPLTRQEAIALQQHCAFGLEIGQKLYLTPDAMNVVAQHHERVDGSGYPKGLKGPQIQCPVPEIRHIEIRPDGDDRAAGRLGRYRAYLPCWPGARARHLVEPEGRADMGRSQRRQAGQIPLGICPARRLAIVPISARPMRRISGTGH
jgi:putative nucleotidyltransferase with HDIG domain